LDLFIWEELQVEENLSQIHKKPVAVGTEEAEKIEAEELARPESVKEFLNNEVRDKLEQIGLWLGFNAKTEIKVAEGSSMLFGRGYHR
jgi:hypothetical protein